MKVKYRFCAVLSIFLSTMPSYSDAQTAPPPNLGQETKGKPAISETETAFKRSVSDEGVSDVRNEQKKTLSDNLLGTAKIKESRRESGQVYRIELEHSFGSKQVIEENDSDGQLVSDDKGLEDTPTLSKWRLGSW